MKMELTNDEARELLRIRAERREQQCADEKARRKQKEFPNVLREERGLAIVKPVAGKHVGYYIYDGDTLICVCTYRRGAESLVNYIIANRRNET